MVDNIFQVLGDVTEDFARKELVELKELQAQEETLTAFELTNRVDENVNNFLLDKEKNYSYNGSLASEARGYYEIQKENTVNEITNENVKNRVRLNLEKGEQVFVNRAKALQTSKHLQYQKQKWNEAEATSLSRIVLQGGGLDAVNNEIARWEVNKDGFTQNVQDQAYPATIAKLTKAAIDTELSELEMKLTKVEITPEDFETQVDILEQTVFKNLDTYKFDSNDVRTYGAKFNTIKSNLTKNGVTRYKSSLDSQIAAYKKNIDLGQRSPTDTGFISLLEERKRYSTDAERKQIDQQYEATLINHESTLLAADADVDGLQALESQLTKEYEQAKNSGDPITELTTFTNLSTVAAKRAQAEKLSRTEQGVLFQSNPELKQVINNYGGNAGFNYIASKVNTRSSVSQFRPMLPSQIEDFKFRLSTQGEKFGDWRKQVLDLQNQYAGPVGAMGNKDGWAIATDNIIYDLNKKKRRNAAVSDPFTLGDKQTMLAKFATNLDGSENQELSFLYNYTIAPTTALDSQPAKKKNLKEAVAKEIGKYAAARASRSDIVSTGIPEIVYGPLIEQVAMGHYELTQDKNVNKSAQYAVDQLIKKYIDLEQTFAGDVVVGKDVSREARRVLSSREYTTRAVTSLIESKNPFLEFPDIYKIEGDVDLKVTEDALKNKSQLQFLGDGQYGLYLRFQDKSMQVLEQDTGKPLTFTEDELKPFGGVLQGLRGGGAL